MTLCLLRVSQTGHTAMQVIDINKVICVPTFYYCFNTTTILKQDACPRYSVITSLYNNIDLGHQMNFLWWIET